MNILEKILYYGFGSLVFYYLVLEGASFIKNSFLDALKWTKDQFPATSRFIGTIFSGIESFFAKVQLAKLDFRTKIFKDKVELWVQSEGTFKKVSSVGLEDKYEFKVLEITQYPLGGRYSFEGFFDSMTWKYGLSFLSLLDYFVRDLCNLEKNQPEIGQCELILSIECAEETRIEYYFALMLAYGELKGAWERQYKGLTYPISLKPSCSYYIRDIDLNNKTFLIEKVKQ